VSDSPAPGVQNRDLLAVYCNDHLAAAVGGIELVRRMLGEHRASDYEQPMEQLLGELREEKTSLESMIRGLGVPIRQYKLAAVWVGEKAARLKLNGRLLRRSPLSDLVEFEFLASAVRAKRSGFETLRTVAEVEPRLPKGEIDRLIEQANRQFEWLSRTRRDVAAAIFGGDPTASEEAAGG
jgi:hypothetical protein